MAQGKSKKIPRGRKGAKKRAVDPFSRKEVYDIKAPSMFANQQVGKTFVNKTAGTKIASEALKGRVVETNLSELQESDDLAYRKVKLIVEEVQGKSCLTNFYGLDFTRDQLSILFRKWQTTIEAFVEADTKDGYRLRLFCIGFTSRREKQQKKTCYAKSSQILQIRKIMTDCMAAEVTSNDLKSLVGVLISEKLGNKIKEESAPIFPLVSVFVRKVKVVKRPRFDVSRLLELYKDMPRGVEAAPEDDAAKNLLTQEVMGSK